MKTLKISIEKRQGDYMAYLNNDRRLWDRGRSPAEAIGCLILTHGLDHGIVVDNKSLKAQPA